jgi:long-chain acyl-CoA synthetase
VVSKAEPVGRFRILPVDWSEEGGQLTPSLTIKRHVVAKEHGNEIEAMHRFGA